MTESVAMMRYLAREKRIADHWYPKERDWLLLRSRDWLLPVSKTWD